MANVTLDNSQDFFEEVYRFRLSNCLGIATNIIFGPITILLLCGISWYEKNASDARNTILNKLLTLGSECVVCYGILVQIPEVFRYLYGPFPLWFCRCHLFVKNVILLHCWCFLTSLTVLRFCFIFVLKNPGRFNDDFWMCFIKTTFPVLCILANLAHNFVPGTYFFSTR
jgi:hypothetical protein